LRIDWKDRATWAALALGVPILVACAVLVWGYNVTENRTALPDPAASPVLAIAPDGRVVPIPPTQRPATATPGLGPGTAFRLEGVVVDALGAPIPDVCIAIGPNGCQDHSPRTDQRGVYAVDFPQAQVAYDLHWTKDGYKEVVKRLQPTQNQVLNLILGQ
jgi:hypothetical protein